MLYRKVNTTGDELSILGFGCMRLPQKRGRIDVPRATQQIRLAIDKGVNYIDTAMPYHGGASEPFLAKALSDGYREKVKIATKLPPWDVRAKEDMDRLLLSQLDRLATECIDYYLIHALDRRLWKKMTRHNVLDFLERAKKDGKIRHAGFSFHGDKENFIEIVDAYDWEFCQIQYNFLDENNQAGKEGLEYAASKGMGVVIMEPLRGGNLSKKIPPKVASIWAEAETQRTPVEWALRWIWNHPEVTTVLSGMNEEAHIEENLRIAAEAEPSSLTPTELELVSRVRDTYFEVIKAGCTGCRYCMPCPEGVDIPECFQLLDGHAIFGTPEYRFFYALRLGGVMDEPAMASQCKDCKKCVRKCPQQLPIPDLLDQTAKEFERAWLRPMIWAMRQFFAFQRWKNMRRAKALGSGH